MPSSDVPKTQFVHIFREEFEQHLKWRFQEPIGKNGLCCFLYGLWTHTSNVVVHFIVSNEEESNFAKEHRLDCVGYVAKEYSKNQYNQVKQMTKLSAERQCIIVDISETKRFKELRAHGTDYNAMTDESTAASGQGHLLEVNLLPGGSPFRKEYSKLNPKGENRNGDKIESENHCGSYSDKSNDQENRHKKVSSEGQYWQPLDHLDPQSKRARLAEGETTDHGENGINGHPAKIDPDSTDIRLLKHKVKEEFELDGELLHEERSGKLVFYFIHNEKQWEIALSQDPARGILAQVLTESKEISSKPREFDSQEVINDIKELCQCGKHAEFIRETKV